MDDWFSRPPGNEARPTRGSARPSLHEINDHLLIGEYPRAGDIEWLNKVYGVTAILNLQDDEDLRINALDIAELRDLCSRLGMKLVRSPIHDGSADDMGERLVTALGDLGALVDAGERVYVHCNAGFNRAPTLAIAYLRARGGMSLNEAMAHVKQRRPCGPFMTVLEAHFGPRDLKPGK
jgi:protein-tyrosine phosphatase